MSEAGASLYCTEGLQAMDPDPASGARVSNGSPRFPFFHHPPRTAQAYRQDTRQAASPSAIFQDFGKEEDIVAPTSSVVGGVSGEERKDVGNPREIQSVGVQAENSGWKHLSEANGNQTQQENQSNRLSRGASVLGEKASSSQTHFITQGDKMGVKASRDSGKGTDGKLSEDHQGVVNTHNMRYSTALNPWQLKSGERDLGLSSSARPESSLSCSATFPSSSNLYDRRQHMQHKQSVSTVVGTDNHHLDGPHTDEVEASTSFYLCKNNERHLSDIEEEGFASQQDRTSRRQSPVKALQAVLLDTVQASPVLGVILKATSGDGMHFTQAPERTISTSIAKSTANPLRIVTQGSLPMRDSLIRPRAAYRQSGLDSNNASSSNGLPTAEPDSATCYDVPSPIASPYSSLFTGRSLSTASSGPSTAATSYPSSATCQTSGCASAVLDENALQLSQHQRQSESPKSILVSGKKRTTTEVSRKPRISRYSDFASLNIGTMDNNISLNGKYDWFKQSCPNDRPPLLRSVSADTPISAGSPSSRTFSRSDIRQVKYALEQYNEDGSGHSEVPNRYSSILMGPRALTTPNFGSPSAVSSTSIYSSPASEASSGEASNGISQGSQSSTSTAASSKRSSWCSPYGLAEALPPISTTQDDCTTPIKHSVVASKGDTPTSHASHPNPHAIHAANPLARFTQLPQPYSTRPTIPTPATRSAPSSNASLSGGGPQLEDKLPLASFEPAVAAAIRRAAATVHQYNANAERVKDRGATNLAEHAHHSTGNTSAMQSSLMGACGNGYFGNAIRTKALAILDDLLPTISSTVHNDGVIGIAEYGSLNSLSSSLIPFISSHFASAHQAPDNPPSFQMTYSDGPGSDFRALMKQVDSASHYDYPFHVLNPHIYSSFAARPFPAQVVPSRSVSVGISLMDLHCRKTPISSGVSAATAAHNELRAFLNTRAMEIKKDGLLLLAFIQRQEDETVAAVAAGRSKRAGDQDGPEELIFTSPLRRYEELTEKEPFRDKSYLAPFPTFMFPSISQGKLTDGETLSAYSSAPSFSSSTMSRARSGSSPCKPCFKTEAAVRSSDIWSTIPALLAPCIQRLVSTGLIKSNTASHLLTLPLHPRTPAQTRAVLRAVQHQWRTEWSCGLAEASVDSPEAASSSSTPSPSPSTPTPSTPFAHREDVIESLHHKLDEASVNHNQSSSRRSPTQEEALLLAHPAYTAFQSTALSQVQFAEHAIQFIRVLYDAHFRSVLKDHAKLSRSRLEEVLDALNEVLREKLEETGRAPLPLELEVCMIALRRV